MRIYKITKSYFKLGWNNLPWWFLPISWLLSPIAIIFGYIFLEDWMMHLNEP